MQSIGSSLARVATAAAVLLIGWQGGAAGVDNVPDDQFCEGYADQAVAQTSEAALYPVCELTGPRWDTERDTHLSWCRELRGPPSLATAELAMRHAALITCLMTVFAPPRPPTVTKATDSDGTGGKMDNESDPQEPGTEPPKP